MTAPGTIPTPTSPATAADPLNPSPAAGPQSGRDAVDAGPPTPPAIALPKGGGAIKDIGEKFTVSAPTGTGRFSVPLGTSPGRAGFGPSLNLAYDSGAGNGPFGHGWTMSLPAITRKTDKGLPRYVDDPDADTFILAGAEDLVPIRTLREDTWQEVPSRRTESGHDYLVQGYRPRIEGSFDRIERWRDLKSGETHWRTITSANITTLYGATPDSRIADPADPTRVFSWLISATHDDTGNAARYDYVAENSAGIDTTAPNEFNRTEQSRSANRYPKRIRYGNREPFQPTIADIRSQREPKGGWLFETVFDYGDHRLDGPLPLPDRTWPTRSDPFSSYRAAFEVRTYRQCRRVLNFHHFPAEPGVGADCLVSSTDLTYTVTGGSALTTVASITHTGYRRRGDRYLSAALPPVELSYSQAVVGTEVHDFSPQALQNLPAGIDGTACQWVDLDGEGLSGILARGSRGWTYRHNLGGARFSTPRTLPTQPVTAGSGARPQLLDLTGNGHLDLVEFSGATPGCYERTTTNGWHLFRPFQSRANIAWDDPNLRMVDLDGDGLADVLITGDDAFTWYPALGRNGYGGGQRVFTNDHQDEERGPRLMFADPEQSIYLADMSGDGLSDLVRVRNGEVCYWPNVGFGRFGAKVTMDRSPWLDEPNHFDQRRVRLADVDGTGCADLIYLHPAETRLYLNQSGNGYSPKQAVPQAFPAPDGLAHVTVTDLLGTGTACLVWSSPLPSAAGRQVRYVNLMAAGKPNLLTEMVNNLGAETQIRYASSTQFYLADQAAGRPWITRLPFPVHVVEQIDTIDRINRNRYTTRYAYHHGYFDGFEREFRGFGMVERWDSEDLAVLESRGTGYSNLDASTALPPTLTRTWLHTGVFARRDRITRLYAHEYWREPGGGDPDLSDTGLPATLREPGCAPRPWQLSNTDAREASRALKGMPLREETYALDGSEAESRPYLVTEHNYTIELLQPAITPVPDGPQNYHAVLLTHARESLAAHYERAVYVMPDGGLRADPRVSHEIVLAIDDYGNPLRSATASYGRRYPDPMLGTDDQAAQGRLRLTCSDHGYTNAVELPDAHRTPMPAHARTFEVVGLTPRGQLFDFAELYDGLKSVSSELTYQDWDTHAGDLTAPARRLIAHTRVRYRRDDLSEPLPFGVLESKALHYENYRLAFSDRLVEDLYGPRVDNATLQRQGGYVRIADEDGWWSPSGQVFYSPHEQDDHGAELDYARRHFYTPNRYLSPFGDTTTITYDDYTLLRRETRDAIGNRVTAGERDPQGRIVRDGNDYRVLQPTLLMDANRNRAAVAFDTLGMVVGTAVMGKPEENLGDSLNGFEPDLDNSAVAAFVADPIAHSRALIANATSRLVYDVNAYRHSTGSTNNQPAFVATIARERHVSELNSDEHSRLHTVISYSDGFGREVQKKIQAEGSGPAKDAHLNQQSWIGSGWTIFDNKANAVRIYEAFYTPSHRFEGFRAEGVSTIKCHDPLGRVVGTLHPNSTFEKVSFDPWTHQTWDTNDTVLLDPRADPIVGPLLSRVLADQPGWQTWYEQRITGGRGDDEQLVAQRTAVHADTPSVVWLDTLEHPIANVAHNRFERDGAVTDEHRITRTVRDVQNHQRQIIDPLNRVSARFDYDMLGKAVHQASFEAGTRRILADVGGNTVLLWDERGFRLRHTYDGLRRAVGELVTGEDGRERLTQYTVYGETAVNAEADNLRGKNYLQFDGAGMVAQPHFDFKGNLLKSQRRLSRNYRGAPEWDAVQQRVSTSDQISPDVGTLAADLDDVLDAERFTASTAYDAHNRPTQVIAPDGTAAELQYDDATLLNRVDVVEPGGARSHVVTNIEYNARGERTQISYGNRTYTSYELDPETFRLNRLTTRRPAGVLQDYRHHFDPVGNVIVVRDHAQLNIFHNNAVASPNTSYVYDALYQLLYAEGREHIGQNENTHAARQEQHSPTNHPHDRQAMRRYCENYQYDAAGNLLQLIHSAAGGNWTRRNFYDETSQLAAGQTNNRLSRSTVGSTTRQYSYDTSGNTTAMPHLQELGWDYGDQFVYADLGGGGRAFYSYDTAGRRVRKTIELADGRRAEERIYIGAFEVYRRYRGNEDNCTLQRNTVHVYDNENRVALLETTLTQDGTAIDCPTGIFRYQLTSGAKSVTVETDDDGQLITYEEYHPYGTTAYQIALGSGEVGRKRYRYVGKERDDETGFYYYGARYYDPSLARWTSCDPAGMVDGSNLYRYVKNNPTNFTDPTGQWEMPSWRTVAVVAAVVVVGTIVTVATAGAAGPLVVGAVASVGLTGTAATVATGVAVGAIAGAVGGAAAGAAGEATRQTVNSKALGLGNEEFSGTKIVDAAVKEAKTGAMIGAAVGGAAALATTSAGAAAVGAAGKLAQRVAPNLSKAAVTAARGAGGVATAVAKRTGVTALAEASERVGVSAAKSVFQEGSAGAKAVATFADTGSVAKTFGAEPKPAAPKLPPTVEANTPAVVPGPGTLTPGELDELQAIADKYQTELDVVGSRAKGTGRNIDKPDLPTEIEGGKGPRSDIDVKIDSDVDIRSRGGLSNDVANVSNGAGKSMIRIGDRPNPPYIRINPKPKP